jgi:chromate reductase
MIRIILKKGEIDMTKTIGLICGSLRKDSYNRVIAQALADMDDSIKFH